MTSRQLDQAAALSLLGNVGTPVYQGNVLIKHVALVQTVPVINLDRLVTNK